MRKTLLLLVISIFTVNAWAQVTETGSEVGVGTTTPQEKLNVFGTSNSNINLFSLENSAPWSNQQLTSLVWKDQTRNIVGGIGLKYDGFGTVDMHFHSLYNFDYKTNTNVTMVLKGNGNLGIGTTTPQAKLHVTGTSTIGGDLVSAILGNGYLDWTYFGGTKGGRIRGSDEGYLVIESNPNGVGDKNLYLGLTENILIARGGGNVGIGTSTPNHKLEIANGDLFINNSLKDGGTIRSYGHYMDFKGSTDDAYAHRAYRFYPAAGSTTTVSYLELYKGNTDATFVKTVNIASVGNTYFNGGNVGIGTDNPQEKLEINGGIILNPETASKDYIQFRNNNTPIGIIGSDGSIYGQAASNMGIYVYGSNQFDISTNGLKRLSITGSGNVGIGTTTPGSYKLAVEGKIGAHEIVVTTAGWADFVFEADYNLMPLSELGTYIQQNKHLPEIPTTADVKENGISVGEMNAKLLQKIEELTLYMLNQQQEIDELKAEVKELKK